MIKKTLYKLFLHEEAQGMAECVVLISLIGFVFYGFWEFWSMILVDYFNRIAFIVSLPLP